jgi:hypothetical protein
VPLTENANTLHVNAHVNYNVDGIGLSRGARYSSNASGKASENVTLDNNDIGEATVMFRALLIGHGGVANVSEFVQAHITVNPAGETTSFILNHRLTCH